MDRDSRCHQADRAGRDRVVTSAPKAHEHAAGRGRLRGLRALVTGGCRGIGSAIADQLEAAGALVIRANLPNALRHHASRSPGLDASRTLAVDVTDSGSVTKLFDDAAKLMGGLDILVNNAGVAEERVRVDRMSGTIWERVLAVNLGGMFRCSRAAFSLLRESAYPSITNLTSTWGFGGVPSFPAYCSSKAGVIGLTRSLAADGGPFGIRVNAVSPGYIANDMGSRLHDLTPDQFELAWKARDRQASFRPLSRQASTAEVTSVVAFLCSRDASFVTGAILPVDRGQVSRLNTGEPTEQQ